MDKHLNYPLLMYEPGSTTRILADNLNRLMAAHLSLDSNPKMVKASGLGLGTLARARNAQSAATLDTLEALAKCFELQPWQLLVPGLDVKSLPVLRSLSAAEADLFERLRNVIVKESTSVNSPESPPSPQL